MNAVEACQRECIPTEIHVSADAACRGLAVEIATLIHERAAAGRQVVLGLATGSTPVRLYRELVPDEDAFMAADLMLDFTKGSSVTLAAAMKVCAVPVAKEADHPPGDPPDTRRLKALIRRGEARVAVRIAGLPAAAARFLDLPFYENGRYRQFRSGEADVAMVATLLETLKPHQIFATGEGHDPSSVGAVCFKVLRTAVEQVGSGSWLADCRVWLYRTPYKAWDAHEIDMAVPLSPAQLAQKVQAIYQHKSQRSQTPAGGPGMHEAWQQAEAVARNIAITYDALGLAEDEAIDAFRRWR
jgi:glucosamine-6-phosphate deaminase